MRAGAGARWSLAWALAGAVLLVTGVAREDRRQHDGPAPAASGDAAVSACSGESWRPITARRTEGHRARLVTSQRDGAATAALHEAPKLRERSVRGAVSDWNGRPLAGAPLLLTTGAGLPRRTVSADDGSFRFERCAEGRARVGVAPGSTWFVVRPLGVTLDQAVTWIELVAESANGTVAGRLVDSSGVGVPGVPVVARGHGFALAYADTDDSGRFQLAPLPCGRVEVAIHPRGRMRPAAGRLRPIATGFEPVVVDVCDTVDIGSLLVERPATFRLEGYVHGAVGGAAPARVELTSEGGLAVELALGLDAHFDFRGEVRPQRVRVRARRGAHEVLGPWLSARRGDHVRCDLVLP